MRKQKRGFFKKGSIRLALLAAMLLMLAGCGTKGNDGANGSDEAKNNGGGAKAITLEVVDDKGGSTSYDIHTDEEYLYDACNGVEGLTIDGYDAEYGFYITAVNDIQADFDTNGAYWSLYVNDEYGTNGISTQPVADGDSFKLAYELAE